MARLSFTPVVALLTLAPHLVAAAPVTAIFVLTTTSTTTTPVALSTTASTTTTVSSATSTTPILLPTAAITCPNSDDTTYTIGADTFEIHCGIDYYGGDLALSWEPSFQSCIATCEKTAGCVSVSFGGAACYMKSSTNGAVENSGIWAAKKVASIAPVSPSSSSTSSVSSTTSAAPSPTAISCPDSDGEIVTIGTGSFEVHCGVDYYGGDLALSWEDSFAKCLSACEGTAGCVSVSYTGAACYMKSSNNGAVENSGVWAGKKIVASPVSTTSVTSMSVASSSVTSSSVQSSSTILSFVTSSTTASDTAATTQTPLSVSCPSSDNQIIGVGSDSFKIQCGVDYYGGDLELSWESSFSNCVNTCERTKGCISVSYNGAACYMKSTNNGDTPNANLWSAKKVAPGLSCPAYDGSNYTTKDGAVYKIECSSDRYGEDLDIAWVPDLTSCIKACDAHAGCVDVSFRFPIGEGNGPCYMKKSFEQKVLVDAGIYGALRVSAAPSSLTTSATTLSATTSTLLSSSTTTSFDTGLSTSTLSSTSSATSSSSGISSIILPFTSSTTSSTTTTTTTTTTTSSALSSTSTTTTTTSVTTTTTTMTTTTTTTTTSPIPTQVIVNGGFENIANTNPYNILPWTDSIAVTGGTINYINGVRPVSQNPTYVAGPDAGIIRVYPAKTGVRYTSIYNKTPMLKNTQYQFTFMYRCLNYDAQSAIEVYFNGNRIVRSDTCLSGSAFVKTSPVYFSSDNSGFGEFEVRFLNPTAAPYLYFYADEFFATKV